MAALWLAVPDHKTAREDVQAKLMVFASKLARFPVSAVKAACDQWGDENEVWPTPSQLMTLARQHEAHEAASANGVIGNPEHEQVNAALDEALSMTRSAVLLKVYKLGVREPNEKRLLINALAEWWTPIRPINGPENEIERRQCVNAIEGWFEERLGIDREPKLAEVDPKTMPQRDIRPLVRATVHREGAPA